MSVSSENLRLNKMERKALMDNELFRRFMGCVMFDAGLLQGASNASPQTALFFEGRRQLALDILATLNEAEPDTLLRLLQTNQEVRSRKNAAKRRRTRIDDASDDDATSRADDASDDATD
jgi:hypothetical protein